MRRRNISKQDEGEVREEEWQGDKDVEGDLTCDAVSDLPVLRSALEI